MSFGYPVLKITEFSNSYTVLSIPTVQNRLVCCLCYLTFSSNVKGDVYENHRNINPKGGKFTQSLSKSKIF